MPRQSTEAICGEIKRIISDIVEIEENEITEDLSLFGDLGLDSLDLVDLLGGISKKFGVAVSMDLWKEHMYTEAVNSSAQGARTTLAHLSAATGLQFREEDVEQLQEVLSGSFQTCDVVRTVLGFIRVHSIVAFVSRQMSGQAE